MALAALALSFAIAPAQARADDTTAEQLAAARALGVEGVRLAASGNCAAAIDRLQRAELLHHAPTTLERLGACHVSVGRVVLGSEELRRVVHEPLPPHAPAVFFQAQERAKLALASALGRIAKLRIHVEPPDVAGLALKIDGEPLPVAILDLERPTDPGAHRIVASAPSMRSVERAILLEDGETLEIALNLEPAPSESEPARAPQSHMREEKPAPPVAPRAHGDTAAYAALGVGALGLGVGSVAGVLALGAKGKLDSECDANRGCPAAAQSDIDGLRTRAIVSTVGFGVAVVGLALGGWLLLTSSDRDTDGRGSAESLRLKAQIGIGSMGVAGSF